MSGRLWHRPILHTEREQEDERSVTWLELFYDLVYVASLILLGNMLSKDISWTGVTRFVFLFIPIWWSWTGITFFMNRFIVDDLVHRALIFLQMFFIAAMAIAADDAFGVSSAQFALAYVAVRAVLVLLYVRAGRHTPSARPLTTRYVIGFSLAALVWLISILAPPPARFALWGVAILIDFGAALTSRQANRLVPPDVGHMAERYGLFTIIVLGEAFVKVLSGASEETLGPAAVYYGALGLIIMACLWWLYFDDVAGAQIVMAGWRPYAWIYAHLPIAITLAAYGVALKKLILSDAHHPFKDEYRLLLGGALAAYLIFVAIIELAIVKRDQTTPQRTRVIVRLAAGGAVVLAAIAGGAVATPILISAFALICMTPVGVDLYFDRQAMAG